MPTDPNGKVHSRVDLRFRVARHLQVRRRALRLCGTAAALLKL